METSLESDLNVDLNEEIREFTYLSNVYKFIDKYGIMGHQIGRKVGDMLELICLGKIHKDKELLKRLKIEPKVVGETTAGHKVEFALYNLDNENTIDEDKIFGIIECKKVGVEVTKNSKTKNRPLEVAVNNKLEISIRANWMTKNINLDLNIDKIENSKAFVSIKDDKKYKKSMELKQGDKIKIAIDESGKFYVVSPTQNLYSEVNGIMRICKIYTVERIINDKVYIRILDCLTGPQTIEKAKQASLVAMDLRKKVDNKWGKDDLKESEKTVKSILVISEFSHWEEKSRNVIRKCIDYNIIVPDKVIIEAIKLFEEKVNGNFWEKITKTSFQNDDDIKELIFEIIEDFDGKVFYDIESHEYVDFKFKENKLVIEKSI